LYSFRAVRIEIIDEHFFHFLELMVRAKVTTFKPIDWNISIDENISQYKKKKNKKLCPLHDFKPDSLHIETFLVVMLVQFCKL
jgi:hypothetical protein